MSKGAEAGRPRGTKVIDDGLEIRGARRGPLDPGGPTKRPPKVVVSQIRRSPEFLPACLGGRQRLLDAG